MSVSGIDKIRISQFQCNYVFLENYYIWIYGKLLIMWSWCGLLEILICSLTQNAKNTHLTKAWSACNMLYWYINRKSQSPHNYEFIGKLPYIMWSWCVVPWFIRNIHLLLELICGFQNYRCDVKYWLHVSSIQPRPSHKIPDLHFVLWETGMIVRAT